MNVKKNTSIKKDILTFKVRQSRFTYFFTCIFSTALFKYKILNFSGKK